MIHPNHEQDFKDFLILDFFGGSGTTSQAVTELNEEDGGNRKYILVQSPEQTDEKSEAYKAGYKKISDITIERNKRVVEKIINVKKETTPNLFSKKESEQEEFKKNEILFAIDGDKETLICFDVIIADGTVEHFKTHISKKLIVLDRARLHQEMESKTPYGR